VPGTGLGRYRPLSSWSARVLCSGSSSASELTLGDCLLKPVVGYPEILRMTAQLLDGYPRLIAAPRMPEDEYLITDLSRWEQEEVAQFCDSLITASHADLSHLQVDESQTVTPEDHP
jgi:hypothetical protein